MKQSSQHCISGEFWATRSTASDCGLMVLIDVTRSDVVGYPLFAESLQATAECFLLRNHPEFDCLLDERWINFGAPMPIDTAKLHVRIGQSQYALDCLHAFQQGRELSLDNGVPMINGIGDARETFHRELQRQLRRAAGASALKIIFDKSSRAVHNVLPRLQKLSDALTEGTVPDKSNAYGMLLNSKCLNSKMLKKPLSASILDVLPISHVSPIPCFLCAPTSPDNTDITELQVGSHKIILRTYCRRKNVTYILESPQLSAASFCLDNKQWQPLEHTDDDTFHTPPLPMTPLQFEVVTKDGITEILDLDITE